MELCKFCRDITVNFQATLPLPSGELGREIKHQPDFSNMIQAAGSGCELCQFFLECVEGLSQDEFEKVQKGGELHLCDLSAQPMFLMPPSGPLCYFDCVASDSKVSYLTKLEVDTPSADSSSDICFAKITSWLTQCTTEHPDCGKPCEVVLPTRVIDVGSFDNQNIRLVTTNGLKGLWVALSHCWGNSVSLQLKRGCLTEMEKAIPIESLPPTFQDAVHITRRLGFNYIWIDSLCIIQDSPEDWNQESGQMAYIYSNSVLTVSAEAARDGSVGIFRSANIGRPKSSIKVKCHWNDHDLVDVWLRSLRFPEDREFHLHQRAWALQETLLPPRVLTYTSRQLYYTCRTTQYDEQFPVFPGISYSAAHFQYHNERCRLAKKILFRASSFDEQPVIGPGTVEGGCLDSYPKAPDKDRTSQRPSKVRTGATVEELLQQWFKIVEAYTVRSLTFEKDRLPAIAGIAKVFGGLTGCSYKAGLWDEDLIRGLAWCIEPGPNRYRRARCSDYIAPSWTWVSIPSQVWLNTGFSLRFPDNFEAAEDTTVLETRLEYLSDDPYLGVSAGLLKIRGRCRSLEPKDYAEHIQYFDFTPDDDLDSHLHRSRTGDEVNRLLLLLGKEYLHHLVALILEETDVHGTYKRVGFWRDERWGQDHFNGTIKLLTII